MAIVIFKNPNFVLYPTHILNLVKKLGFKIKVLKVDIVKEQIKQI